MKAITLVLLIASTTSFSLSALSAPNAAAEKKPVTREKFVSEIQASLPKMFCEKTTYFRSCFSSTPEECATTAKTAVEECAKSLNEKMPASFKETAEGQKWGKEIGDCAGGKFETALAAKKIDSADCKNQDKWK